MKLSIIVPVFNEALLLKQFWQLLINTSIRDCTGITSVEIIIVDDGSTDGSLGILRHIASSSCSFSCGTNAQVTLIENAKNFGKGHAVRQGISSSSGDLVIIQDSDLEYRPADYPNLLKPVLANEADAVFGTRFSGSPRRVLYFWHAFMNKLLNLFANIFNNLNLSDVGCCYKVIRGNLARSLSLKSLGFSIEVELAARLARSGSRIFEVPVSYRGRTYEEGKKIRKADGLLMFWSAFWFAFFDREPFKPGLSQSLIALDQATSRLYEPHLRRAFSGLPKSHNELRILEVGSGVGSLTRFLRRLGHVTATDINPDYVRILKERFSYNSDVKVVEWDACKPLANMDGSFDVVVSFNVLEHLENDTESLRNWQSLLAPGGFAIVLVPAFPALFSRVDAALGHFRRYRISSLTRQFLTAKFEVTNRFYGNAFGIIGWYINGRILRKSVLPKGSINLYLLLKKLLGGIEAYCEKFFGLSIIVVAQKPVEELSSDAGIDPEKTEVLRNGRAFEPFFQPTPPLNSPIHS